METKKPTTKQIEKMAIEIRDFLLEHDIWQDVTIFFSGKAYSTSDGRRDFCNNPNNLIVLENVDPRDYFEYVGREHILSMSFHGPLYLHLNGIGDCDLKISEGLEKIFRKYRCYSELGNDWNLTLYAIDDSHSQSGGFVAQFDELLQPRTSQRQW